MTPPEPRTTPQSPCACDTYLLKVAGRHINRFLWGRYLVQQGYVTDGDELTGPERAALRQVAERRERR